MLCTLVLKWEEFYFLNSLALRDTQLYCILLSFLLRFTSLLFSPL